MKAIGWLFYHACPGCLMFLSYSSLLTQRFQPGALTFFNKIKRNTNQILNNFAV